VGIVASYFGSGRIQSTYCGQERFVRKAGAISFLLFCLTTIAGAQIPTGGNIFFGYSYSQGEAFTGSTVPTVLAPSGSAGMNGWEGSLEGKFLPWIGLVADLDWHYGGRTFTQTCSVVPPCASKTFRLNASRHTVLFGPRASVSIGKYTPFAEFLLGVAHQTDSGGGISNSDTTFSRAIGGGLDYKLIKGIAWRVQGDSIHTSFFGQSQDDLRLSTGIVFRF
jgi:hypothetical protein